MSLFEMPKIIVSLFDIIVGVCLNICPICQQPFECPVQRTMLAAAHATEEWLIASRYDENFCPPSIFLHQTCTVHFVKHLSPYTGCISEWIWFEVILVAH